EPRPRPARWARAGTHPGRGSRFRRPGRPAPGSARAMRQGRCPSRSFMCGGSLKLNLINASVQRPSNVAVYFTVGTADSEPVAGLTAEQFKIYEDQAPVSVLESKQTILNPDVAASHYTLLLVDMSGSVSGSKDMPIVVEAARSFTERIQKIEKVAVYGF